VGAVGGGVDVVDSGRGRRERSREPVTQRQRGECARGRGASDTAQARGSPSAASLITRDAALIRRSVDRARSSSRPVRRHRRPSARSDWRCGVARGITQASGAPYMTSLVGGGGPTQRRSRASTCQQRRPSRQRKAISIGGAAWRARAWADGRGVFNQARVRGSPATEPSELR
jgi:hypothetical protein